MKNSVMFYICCLLFLLCNIRPTYGHPHYEVESWNGEGVRILREGNKIPPTLGMILNNNDSIYLSKIDDILNIRDCTNGEVYYCAPHKTMEVLTVRDIIDFDNSFNKENPLAKLIRKVMPDYKILRKEPIRKKAYVTRGPKDDLDKLCQAIFAKQQLSLSDSMGVLYPFTPVEFVVCWIPYGENKCSDSVDMNRPYIPSLTLASAVPDSSCVLTCISYFDSKNVDIDIINSENVCQNLVIRGSFISAISKIELFVIPGLSDKSFLDSLKTFWDAPYVEERTIVDSVFINYVENIKYGVRYGK